MGRSSSLPLCVCVFNLPPYILSSLHVIVVVFFRFLAYVFTCVCLRECVCVLLATVHPFDVILVMWFELLTFEFECVRNQASLWGPGLCTKTDLLRDLKALKFGCGKQHWNLDTSWPWRWVRVRRRNNTLDTTRNPFPLSISLPFPHFLFPPSPVFPN